MARGKVKLDHGGIAAILKSGEMHALVDKVAEEIAGNIRDQGIVVGALEGNGEIPLPVEVSSSTTDRAHASVALAHPAGVAVQAKHGALTKAASAAGVEVR
jgi:hypothetical protein